MSFSQHSSYRRVSQPRQFPGQKLEFNRSDMPLPNPQSVNLELSRGRLTLLKDLVISVVTGAKLPRDHAV